MSTSGAGGCQEEDPCASQGTAVCPACAYKREAAPPPGRATLMDAMLLCFLFPDPTCLAVLKGAGAGPVGAWLVRQKGTDECNDMGSGGSIQGGIPPAACRGGLTSPGSVSPEQLAYWPQRRAAGDSSGQTLWFL